MAARKVKVLIVDDSSAQRKTLRMDLEKGGFQVLEAADGVEGLERLEANLDISLVIVDLNMPNMDGIAMCERMKERNSLSHISILMLTSEASIDLKLRSKQAGVIAWATKPYDAIEIVGLIKKLTGSN